MLQTSLKAALLYYLQGNLVQKSYGEQITKRQLETETDVHFGETWKSYRQQDLHSYLFGGFGYGPDSIHEDDHYGTTFDSNYERDVPPINKTALMRIADDDFKDLNDFVTTQCYQFEANMKNFHYISVKNAEYMWDIDNREDGDHGFVWNFTYSNQVLDYDQAKLEDILKTIENCNGDKTEISNSCGVSLQDLTAAKDYSQFYKEKYPLKIKCKNYLKTNLLYDLATSSISSFAEIFWQNVYYDLQPKAFDKRYENIVWHTTEDYPGFKTPTIEVDVMFQIVSINELNLAGEFMDCVIAVTMNWFDKRLKWAPHGWGEHQINSIRINPTKIWTPHIDVANRLYDYSPLMERKMFANVRYDGLVQFYRLFRIHTNFATSNYLYPYDSQTPQIKLQSVDYADDVIKITTKHMNALNGVHTSASHVFKNQTILSHETILHENFISNSEWDWNGYSYHVIPVTSVSRNGQKFSKLIIDLNVKRNQPFYTLTLFVPILVLTILSPIGLILPVGAGEKMGLQITVLLADVIYIDILQQTVPVFDSFGSSPLILSFFIVSIVLLCVCLMVSTYTLFIYHCAIYECKNFSRSEAKISRAIANMFTKCACGLWEIEIPENTEEIAKHEDDGTFHKKFSIDELQLGFQFYADMLSRLWFFVICFIMILTFFCTFVQSWIRYNMD